MFSVMLTFSILDRYIVQLQVFPITMLWTR